MNLTEKRRGEDMIREWEKAALSALKKADTKIAVPDDVKKKAAQISELAAEIINAGFQVKQAGSYYTLGKGSCIAEPADTHPERVAAIKAGQAQRAAVNTKAQKLIVELWDGGHTFASLSTQLS